MIKFTCAKDIFRMIHGREKLMIQIRHYVPIISWRKTIWKYLGGFLSIMVDKSDLEKGKNQ